MKKVRSFLVHASFDYHFIKDFRKIAKPLTNLLVKDVPFHFSKECHVAFSKLRKALTAAPSLHPPIWGDPFELICDASNYAIGIILGQHVDKKQHVIYYASHTLNDAHLNYTVTEKEFLVVIFRFKKLDLILLGLMLLYILITLLLIIFILTRMLNLDL